MKTIILAHQKTKINHCWLNPAIMPILSQPLIAYCLKSLCEAGIRELVITVADDGHLVEEFCEQGAKWGIRISYLLVRNNFTPNHVVENLICRQSEKLLVIDASYLWEVKNISNMVSNEHHSKPLRFVGRDQRVAAVIQNKKLFDWSRSTRSLELIANDLFRLNTLDMYYQINMKVMNQLNASLDQQRNRCGNTLMHQSQAKLIAGSENSYLGEHTVCHGQVSVKNSVLMSGVVALDSDISSCVVMPNMLVDNDVNNQVVGFDRFMKKNKLRKSLFRGVSKMLCRGKIRTYCYLQKKLNLSKRSKCFRAWVQSYDADKFFSKKILDQLYRTF